MSRHVNIARVRCQRRWIIAWNSLGKTLKSPELRSLTDVCVLQRAPKPNSDVMTVGAFRGRIIAMESSTVFTAKTKSETAVRLPAVTFKYELIIIIFIHTWSPWHTTQIQIERKRTKIKKVKKKEKTHRYAYIKLHIQPCFNSWN